MRRCARAGLLEQLVDAGALGLATDEQDPVGGQAPRPRHRNRHQPRPPPSRRVPSSGWLRSVPLRPGAMSSITRSKRARPEPQDAVRGAVLPSELSGRASGLTRRRLRARSKVDTTVSRPLGLIGVPTSAGAFAPGQEQAPRALRDAGLVESLRHAAFWCMTTKIERSGAGALTATIGAPRT